jgi:cytidylate kinase
VERHNCAATCRGDGNQVNPAVARTGDDLAGTYPSSVSSASFLGVVALDGPAGTGKSTVARLLAERLHAHYLDTGAMYRAATVAVLRAGVDAQDPQNAAAVVSVVADSRIEVSLDPAGRTVLLNGQDVTAEIRSAATTAAVSAVSAVPQVREVLVAEQRRLIGLGATVAEGRDIGSTVWPQAELKVYLTATEQVRARRRAGELGKQDTTEIAEAIRRRDALDSGRAASPLRRPDGALEIDTSELSIDQVVEALTGLARRAAAVHAASSSSAPTPR